jgi:DNA-binding transcriptional ArsR family regulator
MTDVSRIKLELLYLIADSPGSTQAQIRRSAGGRRGLKTASQVSGHIADLEELGLVKTNRGRGVNNDLHLTSDGIELLRDDVERRNAILDALSSG